MERGSSVSAATLRVRQSALSGSQGSPVVKPAWGSAPVQGMGVRTGSRPIPSPGWRSSAGSRTRSGGIGTSSSPSSSP